MKIGESIPSFSLLNQDGLPVNSTDLIGDPLVIFFYPKDDTPVCTTEACTFRDHFEDFRELNIKVIGISADSPNSHARFRAKHRLNFDLLSDENKAVEKLFGLRRSLFGLLAQRVTFIFDSQGMLTHQIGSRFQAKKHVHEALKALR
ncbi:peroxiredoxin [Reichenbachiella agarivorans]|uniref:thioredoxin-dependent peroxiredoxin n=1 Tax=Reichenbachiella agarivorans TaxID=2979464 RepID=A0ABY6CPK0_9BACT|nr:peroxiredoxin [Reichenbachiella agarivorans]UXP32456.1 peroxiredoxin [Reichenbachiella agarivorans]